MNCGGGQPSEPEPSGGSPTAMGVIGVNGNVTDVAASGGAMGEVNGAIGESGGAIGESGGAVGETGGAIGESGGAIGESGGATSTLDVGSCLPSVTADLVQYLGAAPYSGSAAMTMKVWEVASPEWQAARSAAVAWARADCAGFKAAAAIMGYEAARVTDSSSQRLYWVLRDNSQQFQGVFAFIEPALAPKARPLVIDSPHYGFDFKDDRAALLFRDLNAVAYLQNSAHRCNLLSCSGCSTVQNYACDGDCMRDSDVVHAVRNGYFAVYDGLESARDDFHFEYHGASSSNNLPGCAGTAHISQASSIKLTAAEDDGTYPNRFWMALKASVGDACACYHQRQTGCFLNGAASTAGRRTNQEATLQNPGLAVCTESATALSGRFVHMEAYNVDPQLVAAALSQAVPLP